MQRKFIRPVLASVAAVLLLPAMAAAEMVSGYPDAVVCTVGDYRVVGYIHRVNADGSAVYMTLGGQFAEVSTDGILRRDGATDCDGKTLEQLAADGQAFDLGS